MVCPVIGTYSLSESQLGEREQGKMKTWSHPNSTLQWKTTLLKTVETRFITPESIENNDENFHDYTAQKSTATQSINNAKKKQIHNFNKQTQKSLNHTVVGSFLRQITIIPTSWYVKKIMNWLIT